MAGALRAAAAWRPDLVEGVYARALYPGIARGLGAIARRVPFSLAEALAALALIAAALVAARGIVRAVRQPDGRRLLAGLAGFAAGAAAVYVVFLIAWGLNYARLPLGVSVGLPVAPAARAELAAACAELVALADAWRGEVEEDASGVARHRGGVAGALARAALGFEVAAGGWPVLAGSPPVVKAAAFSPVLARLGISGIFVPVTGEAHVNTTLPEWTLPFTAAHEVAHQRGFAREDEANYLAFATGSRHPDPEARYAAALMASAYALGALRRVDPAASGELDGRRGAGTRRDLGALEAWRRKYEGRASAMNRRVNDAYLRSQGQADGVASYGRMVDLLLAERRAAGPFTGRPTAPAPR